MDEEVSKEAPPEPVLRELPSCLSEIEGISRADFHAEIERHIEELEERGPEPDVAATKARRYRRKCEQMWKHYEMSLQVAVFDHRQALTAETATESLISIVEGSWIAAVQEAAQHRQMCDMLVPGSDAIADGLVLQVKANIGADRRRTARTVATEIAAEFPDRFDRIAGCFDSDELATIKSNAAKYPQPRLSAEPVGTGIPECDTYARGSACMERLVGSSEELRLYFEEQKIEAAEIKNASKKEREAHRKRCANFVRDVREDETHDWCFALDYDEAKHGPRSR